MDWTELLLVTTGVIFPVMNFALLLWLAIMLKRLKLLLRLLMRTCPKLTMVGGDDLKGHP